MSVTGKTNATVSGEPKRVGLDGMEIQEVTAPIKEANAVPPAPVVVEPAFGPLLGADLSSPAQKRLEQAVKKYTTRLDELMPVIAASNLAHGRPMDAPGGVPDAVRKELLLSTKQLFKDIPLGALVPDASAELAKLGVNASPGVTLGEAGGSGERIATQLANRLKDESPAAYYSLAAAAGAAAGAIGYAHGSEAMRKAGLKPDFSAAKDVMGVTAIARASAAWDPKLTNPSLTVSAGGQLRLNPATLGGPNPGGVTTVATVMGHAKIGAPTLKELRRPELQSVGISAELARVKEGTFGFQRETASVGGAMNLIKAQDNRPGGTEFSLWANVRNPLEEGRFSLSQTYTGGNLAQMSAQLDYRRNRLTLSGAYLRDNMADTTTGVASVWYLSQDRRTAFGGYAFVEKGAQDHKTDKGVGLFLNHQLD